MPSSIHPTGRECEGAGRTVSISRAMNLVTEVLRHNIGGLRLQELVATSDLSKTTVHRLLQELTANGLLRKTPDRRYRLGRLAYELGIGSSVDFQLADLCGADVEHLARQTGDTVFLAIRSGSSALCVDKKSDGRSAALGPPKGFSNPLGVGAAGLALLSSLPDTQQREFLHINSRRIGSFNGLKPDTVARLAQEARTTGYACIGNYVIPGVTAIGIALSDRIGRPLVSLSVASQNRNMSQAHQREVKCFLTEVRHKLREKLLSSYSAVELFG